MDSVLKKGECQHLRELRVRLISILRAFFLYVLSLMELSG